MLLSGCIANNGCIAVSRLALPAIFPKHQEKFSVHNSTVSQMLKDEIRPSLPKYAVTFDYVLRYMDSLPNNNELMLEMLTKIFVHCGFYIVGREDKQ